VIPLGISKRQTIAVGSPHLEGESRGDPETLANLPEAQAFSTKLVNMVPVKNLLG